MNLIKVDFPPLLGRGIHEISLSDLRSLVVDGFPDSRRRPALFECLLTYLELLRDLGLVADVWIDGSFMCNKHEPEDIDMVVLYDPAVVRDLSDANWNAVNDLLTTEYAKARFNLDVHAVSGDDEEGTAFWFQKFGTQRDEITPKGLALLRLTP
ncbi:DUF6932 family protein [Pseudomonas crudilactis]|uniref:DUF6932 family protein n=1 Tax=Pseudomonas crudilactis TaxID=2697028 RepID=UPI001C5C9F90|nr:hypothetical protein [Pseudomonas crudilactis]